MSETMVEVVAVAVVAGEEDEVGDVAEDSTTTAVPDLKMAVGGAGEVDLLGAAVCVPVLFIILISTHPQPFEGSSSASITTTVSSTLSYTPRKSNQRIPLFLPRPVFVSRYSQLPFSASGPQTFPSSSYTLSAFPLPLSHTPTRGSLAPSITTL
jgi:hypothetical protein